VFRFSQHTERGVFDMDLPRMPSRVFVLSQKISTSVSSSPWSSSTATDTKTREAATSILVSTPAKSEPARSSHSTEASESALPEKTTNTAAIAAGVLGALVGIALVLGGVLFLLRQARKRREAEGKERQADLMVDGNGQGAYAYHVQELPVQPSELPGEGHGQPRELKGSTPGDWH
jgi:hypothetical protein